jgi:hypothetical protein
MRSVQEPVYIVPKFSMIEIVLPEERNVCANFSACPGARANMSVMVICRLLKPAAASNGFSYHFGIELSEIGYGYFQVVGGAGRSLPQCACRPPPLLSPAFAPTDDREIDRVRRRTERRHDG